MTSSYSLFSKAHHGNDFTDLCRQTRQFRPKSKWKGESNRFPWNSNQWPFATNSYSWIKRYGNEGENCHDFLDGSSINPENECFARLILFAITSKTKITIVTSALNEIMIVPCSVYSNDHPLYLITCCDNYFCFTTSETPPLPLLLPFKLNTG